MMYIALIGDIIESKKIQDRAQVQQQLLRLMKELNWQYQDYLISPFTVTTGDEFLYVSNHRSAFCCIFSL